ncbi:MAG: 50S ribosomal protein L13 [Candidatus Magasanikbacteria bacterium]|nr:50S ribosomal protein L13 [Candidatus Magasanikbacteria bacterium]
MSRVSRKTIALDAAGNTPGRLATQIAQILIGKHKVSYVPQWDMGDRVTVTNADQAVFTGKKAAQKVYRHHSMHPGGLKEIPANMVIREKPEFVIKHAVSKMLPRNKFRTARLKRLRFVK